MSNKNIKLMMPLLWVIFTDALGWGIAFSVFAALILNKNQRMLPVGYDSQTMKYIVYESLLAIYSIFMFFSAPVIGAIADHYGRKPALNISMFGLTAGFVISGVGCLTYNLWLLFLGRIVSGCTAGSYSAAQTALIDISTPKTKSAYLSFSLLANTLGFASGPFLGSFLMRLKLGPTGTTTFLTASLIGLLGIIGLSLFFKETYTRTSESKMNISKSFVNIVDAFKRPEVNKILFSFLFSMISFGLFYANIPIFLKRHFLSSTTQIGSILSILTLSLSVSSILGGKFLFVRYKVSTVVFITFLIQLIDYSLLTSILNSFVINCILFGFISLSVGLMYVGLITMASDVTDSAHQGRIIGVIAALFSVTWSVGPMLAGSLNHFGESQPFAMSLVLITVTVFIFYFLLQKAKPIKEECSSD